jgi:hypothetical protein
VLELPGCKRGICAVRCPRGKHPVDARAATIGAFFREAANLLKIKPVSKSHLQVNDVKTPASIA